MDEKSVGARISKLRAEKNLTQVELADMLGVSDKAVSKWEVGGCYPDISNIPALADIFGVTTDFILCGISRTIQKLIIAPTYDYLDGKPANDSINKNYLEKGWKITQFTFDGKETGLMAVVLEKQILDK